MKAESPHAPTTEERRPIVYENGPADFAAEDGSPDPGTGTGTGPDPDGKDSEHQDDVLEDREPENGESAAGEPEVRASEDGTPKDSTPKDSTPKDSTPENSADDDVPDADAPDVDPVVRRTSRVRALVRRGRIPVTSGLLLQLVPAVALVVLSVLLVIVWRQNADLSDDARQRRDLNSSAGKVASTFFNWDYQHMDQSFAAKYPLLTKAAADAIRPTAATLTSYFTVNKVSSAATIGGIYPGEIKGDDANVMVIINTKVTTSKSVQSNTGATVAISMKRVSGKWLAGNITLLSSGVESTTDQNGKPLPKTNGSTQPNAIPGQPTP
ncbi:hypothetical protein ACRYCC_05350 [Actinomadura scrupuli]|uniref:hypothetical protein n=1 Tax=Actinomadura scrupuli TaxID=559629 RepID=UPI003D9628CC